MKMLVISNMYEPCPFLIAEASSDYLYFNLRTCACPFVDKYRLHHQAIDADLKRTCESVIALIADPAVAPLRSISEAPLAGQSFEGVRAADSAFRDACARDLRAGVSRLRLYLADERTAAVLLRHIRERVEEGHGAFIERVGVREGVMSGEEAMDLVREVTSEGEERLDQGGGSASTSL
jgi:conserved oligomeric Golgi complex subunit 3